MSKDHIAILRKRGEEQFAAGNKEFAADLFEAADAYCDLIVELGPQRAVRSMSRVGEQMRQDQAALLKNIKK
jgi:hypothetical protein